MGAVSFGLLVSGEGTDTVLEIRRLLGLYLMQVVFFVLLNI